MANEDEMICSVAITVPRGTNSEHALCTLSPSSPLPVHNCVCMAAWLDMLVVQELLPWVLPRWPITVRLTEGWK